MDEQRVQAYLSLIQELLECPGGEEPQILSRHQELVDEGFVQVCELVAAQLQEEGQENNAGFLRNVAKQLGAFLARGENRRESARRITAILVTTAASGNAGRAIQPQGIK